MKSQNKSTTSNATPVKRNYPGVENLLAACQLCHFRIDHGHHRVTRSITLAARAAAAGQLGLLPDTALTRTEPPTPPRPTRGRAPAAAHQLPFPEPEQETTPISGVRAGSLGVASPAEAASQQVGTAITEHHSLE
ncbi:hypothetical protein [Streptomyces lavendulae]|uniref:hypothetical protein n=1 Tax=Streptomyces lavendulae TaxID=1914 RepID=UPI0033FCEC70